MNGIAIRAIKIYQQYISPRKGFSCAYRVTTNDLSCSEFAKRQIETKGLFKALPNIRHRFKKCRQAALQLTEERNKKRSREEEFDECFKQQCQGLCTGAACQATPTVCACDLF